MARFPSRPLGLGGGGDYAAPMCVNRLRPSPDRRRAGVRSVPRGLLGLVLLAGPRLVSAAEAASPEAAAPPGAVESVDIGAATRGEPGGALIIAVTPGSGAEAAGLAAGDLVEAVDGQAVGEGAAGARDLLAGPPGSEVRLRVRAPLNGPTREVVVRRVPGTRPSVGGGWPHVDAWRQAAREGSPREIRKALRALVAHDFDGQREREALGAGGIQPGSADPARVRAVIAALRPLARRGDPVAAELIGQAWLLGARDRDRALAAFERALDLRPPDVVAPGFSADAGGAALLHNNLLMLLAGQEEARRLAEAWADTGDPPGFAARQLAGNDWQPGPEWRPALGRTPAAPFEVRLTDGTPWSLEAHRGQVVLLAFWATWCHPCQEELPELEKLAAERAGPDFAPLLVSIDDRPEDLDRFLAGRPVALPLARAPELGARYGLSGVPLTLLIDRDGQVALRVEGYGGQGLDALAAHVDRTIAGGPVTPAIGRPFTSPSVEARVEFADLVEAPEARGLAAAPGGLAVARARAGVRWIAEDGSARDFSDVGAVLKVAWLDGVVAAGAEGPWLRAWDRDGAPRWFLGTPGRVRALASDGACLVAATSKAVFALEPDGRVAWRVDRPLRDVAVEPRAEGAAPGCAGLRGWAVDGERRWRLGPGGLADAGPAVRAWRVGSDGTVAGAVAAQVLVGRFGPGGENRVAVLRDGEGIVVLDGQGRAALTLDLDGPRGLATTPRSDGSGDDLLVSLSEHGVARFRLEVP